MAFPELLIFDMDGLLFDTERMFMELRSGVLKKYGYIHREEDYLRTVGTAGTLLHSILAEIYGEDYPADTISRETRLLQHEQIRTNGLVPKPGITALLEWAKDRGICCCVATSSPRESAEMFLKAGGLRPLISYVIAGDEVTAAKPDPEIFLLACSQKQTEPSHALVLEDSENGILAALNGGIPVICIPDLKTPSPEILNRTAAVFGSADEVIPWLEQRSD